MWEIPHCLISHLPKSHGQVQSQWGKTLYFRKAWQWQSVNEQLINTNPHGHSFTSTDKKYSPAHQDIQKSYLIMVLGAKPRI